MPIGCRLHSARVIELSQITDGSYDDDVREKVQVLPGDDSGRRE